MSRFKKYMLALVGFCFGGYCAFAEGSSGTVNTTVNDALTGWINDVNATMSTWAGSLAPLFTLGITILLLVVGWRLFKRITKSSS